MSKAKESITKLRDLPVDELRGALARVRDELFRLQLGRHTNQVASVAEITSKRREVARILTVLRGRELGNETQGAAKAAPEAKKTRRSKKEG
ncbi:MAG: 50S ribosomal protein L29 [Myxococcales bacterium]|nr:50S ribosomal protein L29 [Myxococcales bacterium]MBK7197247.1 50S ribosomal protein L29 [Myxococcales bacterium]